MATPAEVKAKAEAEEKERTEEAARVAQEAKEESERVAKAAEEASLKPPPKKGEGEPSVAELQQQVSTTQGMLKQAQSELSVLKNQGQDFEGLRSTIEQQGETLILITDVLGSMAEGNEDLQARVKKSQDEISRRAEAQKQFNSTFNQMGGIAKIAGLIPQDDALKPAFEALNKGDYPGALQLTTLAVQAKVSTADFKKPAEEPSAEEKAKEKKKLPVSTSTSTAPQDWRNQPAKHKIQAGLRDKREE